MVLEHELGRSPFGLAERALGDGSARDGDPQVLEHVERRVEGAVPRGRAVSNMAVPAAVLELGADHRLAERAKPRVAAEEVRTEPEPEPEVAEIDALEHELPVDVLAGRHEAVEQPLKGRLGGRMILGEAESDEQQQRPRRGGPATLGPLAVGALVCEELGRPARLGGAPALGLPDLDRLVEQVAHDLPANRRVTLEKPLDDRVGARRRRFSPHASTGRLPGIVVHDFEIVADRLLGLRSSKAASAHL